eukprot:scaffold274_cov384-Prasinococcus_capsulatus_cf.AAC.3
MPEKRQKKRQERKAEKEKLKEAALEKKKEAVLQKRKRQSHLLSKDCMFSPADRGPPAPVRPKALLALALITIRAVRFVVQCGPSYTALATMPRRFRRA